MQDNLSFLHAFVRYLKIYFCEALLQLDPINRFMIAEELGSGSSAYPISCRYYVQFLERESHESVVNKQVDAVCLAAKFVDESERSWVENAAKEMYQRLYDGAVLLAPEADVPFHKEAMLKVKVAFWPIMCQSTCEVVRERLE